MLPKLKVLFLCTGNSCRSQMAEGWARVLHAGQLDAHSAGTAPQALDPRAIQVMQEVGVDLSLQRPKSVRELQGTDFDWVISVCDRAREACPVFPGSVRRMHVAFDDPPRLAAGAGSEAERLEHYRRVRDEIRAFVETLPDSLAELRSPQPARAEDLDAVVALVHGAGLPIAGLADAFPGGYTVLRADREIIAVAGLETHGNVGLLRSVAVGAAQRGTGLGRLLVEDRLAAAGKRGFRAVYLLTTTAAGFFRSLGFEDVPRASVPAELQRSSEFSSVCPSTAVCLVKRLAT